MSQAVLDAPVPANEIAERPLGIDAIAAGAATPRRDSDAGEEALPR